MFSTEPIALSVPTLTGFVKSAGQNRVNDIDGKRIHNTVKFAELSDLDEIAYQHLYQAFAFVLAVPTVLEIQAFGLPISVSGELDGPLIKGVMSASLWTWKRFLPLASHKDCSEWLIKVANGMYIGYFTGISYFQDLKSTPQGNNFALVKK